MSASVPQDESLMRKKVYNMMEDMKGKIRVYARVRPMLQFEGARGQRPAISIPDELTVEHMWKDKKREYNFDSVFAPESTQEQVNSSSNAWDWSLLTQVPMRAL